MPCWKAEGSPAIVHGCLGHRTSPKGTWSTPSGCWSQGLALCRASGNRNALRHDRGGPGLCLCAPGAPRGGARAAGGGDQRAYPHGRAATIMPTGSHGSARFVVWQGRGEEAGQHARQALDLARQQKARGDEAHALHQLGVVYAHAAPPDVAQAEAHYQQALALAEELGMRPLDGPLPPRPWHPICSRSTGGSRLVLNCPLLSTLYRAMDMTFWLPQAEAARAHVG